MELKVRIKKELHHFTLDVRFEINSSMALLGASGSGKSMTLKCIAGIEKPDEGTIILNGRTLFDSEKGINVPPQKRNVGYLFQNYALFPNMTVRENIAVPPMSNSDKADRLMEEFYITDIADKYPNEISGGQQQRVAFARIIASEPELILLDEPFSAVDAHMRWSLERTAAEAIKRFGGISIMVTHDMGEAYRNCGKICVLDNGVSNKVVSSDVFVSKPDTVSAAKISGCKNIFKFEKTNKNRIFIPELNIYFIMSEIAEDRSYVGLKEEDLGFEGTVNKIECIIENISEDIYSKIITVKPLNACRTIVVTADKSFEKISGEKINLYIEEDKILLLK